MGESFQNALLKVGEIRSLVCESVNIMALTATTTCAVRQDVESALGMKHPVVITLSPSKSNIYYTVKEVSLHHRCFHSHARTATSVAL